MLYNVRNAFYAQLKWKCILCKETATAEASDAAQKEYKRGENDNIRKGRDCEDNLIKYNLISIPLWMGF